MTAPLTIDDPAYFDRLAEVEAAHWWSLGMWRLASHWLAASVRGRRGLRALDVGCGTGLTLLRLARLPGVASAMGLDPSPEALAHARGRHGLPLVRGSALELPFEDGSFDVITCFDVLQHLPPGGDLRAASELRRVLRPGGVAVIRSNARGPRTPRPDVETCYRLDELVDVFEGAGLSVRRASYANFLPALAQEVRGKLARGRGVHGHPSGGGLQIRLPHPGINRLLGCVSAAEAAVAGRLGARIPFGHSTMVLASAVDSAAAAYATARPDRTPPNPPLEQGGRNRNRARGASFSPPVPRGGGGGSSRTPSRGHDPHVIRAGSHPCAECGNRDEIAPLGADVSPSRAGTRWR